MTLAGNLLAVGFVCFSEVVGVLPHGSRREAVCACGHVGIQFGFPCADVPVLG